MKTIRLTMAQALVRFLENQYIAYDGIEHPFVEGVDAGLLPQLAERAVSDRRSVRKRAVSRSGRARTSRAWRTPPSRLRSR